MKEQVAHQCDQHPDPFECPDALVHYSKVFDEYGLIIHGSPAVSHIHFCPWCGTKLPDSKRDRWFDELRAIGFEYPDDAPDVPPRYRTGEWYGA